MKKSITISLGIIIFIVIIIVGAFIWYNSQLKCVNNQQIESKTIEIKPKTGTVEILKLLKDNNIIKNVLSAEIYIKLNGVKGLQAGKYVLSTDMPLEAVLTKISSGEVLDEQVNITFLEGKNMRWYASEIANATNNSEEDVYELLNDSNYIKGLINKYWFLTDEVLNSNIYYPLEGYLYPNTYTFENADISVKEIFEVLLNQTDKVLSKYKTQIKNSGYSIHQILTISSIIELEGKTSEERNGIARVIYNRIARNMSIGSDVTTYYGLKIDMNEKNLTNEEIKTYNPYNTRGPNMSGKLPVGPIASVSEDAINSALNPTNSSYLYFVADKNGKIYFCNTYDEHQKIIQSLKAQGLWFEYN